MSDLESRLHRDGWEVRPAALVELPALLGRVSSVDEPDRLTLLEILARVAATGEQSPARVPSGWAEAWARGRERLLPLLDERELRDAVLRALGSGGGQAGAPVLEELRARWDADQSRLDVVCTVAQFADSDPAAVEWLRDVPVTTREERFAIACALGLGFDEYVAGLRADMAPWLASVWKKPRFLYPWATWRYIDAEDWETHTALLVAAHQRDADLGLRRAEMVEIAYLLTRWRTPTEALVPLLVNRLDDPEERIRRRAVLLLGWVRAAEHADAVRALVDDEGAGLAAVWALSRFGTVVPELAQRLDRFPPFRESDDEMFLPWLAGALSPLRDHADELLPAVLELVKDATGAPRRHLLTVLNAWGRADLAPGGEDAAGPAGDAPEALSADRGGAAGPGGGGATDVVFRRVAGVCGGRGRAGGLGLMLDGLGDIAWELLETDEGTAEEIPHLLRARRYSTNPDRDLLELLCHRDGVYSGAVAALPFLVELASSADTPGRAPVLINLGGLARRGAGDPSWQAVWERVRPDVLALVEDDDPDVRLQAWEAYGEGRGAPGNVLDVLRARWSDVDARLDMVMCAAVFADDEEVAAWLRGLPREDPQLRLAVGYALKLGVEEFLPGLTGDMSPWQQTATLAFGPIMTVERFAEAFAERPEEHTALLKELSAVPQLRKACLRNTGVLLSRWRSPQAELLEIAASRLTDPDPDVRFDAVYLLGAARAEEYTEDVAALQNDDSERWRQTVADAAVWALARCGRRTPDLVRRMRPFEHSTPHRRYFTRLPALGQTLRSIATEALPEVDELVALLHTEHRPAAMRALGRIGVPVPEIEPTDPGAAWAWWRCGGDPARAADVIAAGEIDLNAVRMLRDLGPAAAKYVDLLPMDDDWALMRVATRHAFLRMTGEPGDLVEVCAQLLRDLPDGFEPATIPAARALAEIDALPALELDPARRYCCFNGWRGFDQDEEFRALLEDPFGD